MHWHKISPEDAKEILRLRLEEKWSYMRIASRFNVGHRTVMYWVQKGIRDEPVAIVKEDMLRMKTSWGGRRVSQKPKPKTYKDYLGKYLNEKGKFMTPDEYLVKYDRD